MARVDRRPRQRLPIAQRRAAILTAAQAAFATAPYDQVSLAGIATTAGASEALVHRYFATKSELYVEIVEHAAAELEERWRAAAAAAGGPSADGWTRVALAIDAYLDFVAVSGAGWASPLRAPDAGFSPARQVRTEARERFVGYVRDTLDRPAGDAENQALHGYLGFLDSAALTWSRAGCPDGQRSGLITMALGALSGALAALDAEDE
ncbi:MAG: TetR family transcriptional regulator [Nakamurella sp.]